MPSSRDRYVNPRWTLRPTTSMCGQTVCGDSSQSERESRTSCASVGSIPTSIGTENEASEREDSSRSVQRDVPIVSEMRGLTTCDEQIDLKATLSNVVVEIEMKQTMFRSTKVHCKIRGFAHGHSLWRHPAYGWRTRHVEVALDAMRSLVMDVDHVIRLACSWRRLRPIKDSESVHITHSVEWRDNICWGGDASYDPDVDGRIALSAVYCAIITPEDATDQTAVDNALLADTHVLFCGIHEENTSNTSSTHSITPEKVDFSYDTLRIRSKDGRTPANRSYEGQRLGSPA